ncbi:MAG: type II 3-dehydroquinate dehydratase [Acidimicrobiales bacterium]
MKTVVLLSGPNLDLLGERQPEVYGWATLADHVGRATERGGDLGLRIEHLQSNHEGDLVEAVHRARRTADGIIVNPGALTHYSWALHDALAAFEGPVIELHLSNPAGRDGWRQTSVVAPVATGTIAGFGADGYRLAVEAMVQLLADDLLDDDPDRSTPG